MENELITDTNGKLTILINTKYAIIHIYFVDCIIITELLYVGSKGNVDIMKHLVFIGKICLPTSLFSSEQLDYLKKFKKFI